MRVLRVCVIVAICAAFGESQILDSTPQNASAKINAKNTAEIDKKTNTKITNNTAAKSNRSLWIYPLDSKSAFDFASKMEILVFVRVLNAESSHLEDTDTLGEFLDSTRLRMLRNFNNAILADKNDFLPKKSVESYEDLSALAADLETILPKDLNAWLQNSQKFYTEYLGEQLRLARLFPKTTSEIARLSESEILGDEIGDRRLVLSFDDGPTKIDANTDKLTSWLRTEQIPAVFFILENAVKSRGEAWRLRELYSGFSVGFHGAEHKPHIKKEVWQNAEDKTYRVAKLGSDKNCYFRPPYGQRSIELVSEIHAKGCKIVLWNIDSKDWSSKINAQEMLNRLVSLTLLNRSGIVLFHDTNPKSLAILPQFVELMRSTGVEFVGLSGFVE